MLKQQVPLRRALRQLMCTKLLKVTRHAFFSFISPPAFQKFVSFIGENERILSGLFLWPNVYWEGLNEWEELGCALRRVWDFYKKNYLAWREPLNGLGILQNETQTRLFAFVLSPLRLESVPQSATLWPLIFQSLNRANNPVLTYNGPGKCD